jgi:hypothetical protein
MASDTHRLAQTGLSLVAVRSIQHAFASLDLYNLRGTLPNFTASIAAIVRHYAPASSVLAIRHYEEERLAAGVSGSFRPLAADPVPLNRIASNVQWATKPLWGPNPNVELATTNTEDVVDRLIRDVGRATTLDNVQRDRAAKGWARETKSATPCAFCSMLASRGSVFKTRAMADFKAHNKCECIAVPDFGQYEMTADARQWAADWANLRDANGGSLSLNEWRRHIEGRPTPDDPRLAGS